MVNFEDGKLVKDAYVEINGVQKKVNMPVYSGNTPLNAENLNKLQKDLQNDIDINKNKNNDLQNQINSLASGSPLVASSIEEMTDTTRVYVNTTDGHWYYYTGSVWSDGGVYQATEIADNSISKEKTDFYSISNFNLFNKKSLIPNKFVNATTGTLLTPTLAGNWFASDFIEIESNTPYIMTEPGRESNEYQTYCWFDENKVYISGEVRNLSKGNTPFISPVNAKYLRVTVNENYENLVINEGGILNTFTENLQLIRDLNFLKTIFIEKNYNKTNNLLDINRILKDLYVDINGIVSAPSDGTHVYLTDYIPLDFENYICFKYNPRFIAEFDENYKFLKFDSNISKNFKPLNENCKYIRITLKDTNIENQIITYGETLSENINKNAYLPNIENKSISKDMLIDTFLSSNIENKHCYFLGDSITEGYDGANMPNLVENPFPKLVQQEFKCFSHNLGIGGSTLAGNNADIGENAMNIRLQNIDKNADFIIVFGGTNDLSKNVPIGTPNDETNLTFYGSLNKMCKYFYENFNNTKICFITPIKRSSYVSNDNQLKQYVEPILEICNKFAIPVLDLFNNGQCYPFIDNWKINNLPDGLHPNQNYYNYLADKIGNFLNTI